MPENHKILAKPEENSNDFFLKATTKGEKCGKTENWLKSCRKTKKGFFVHDSKRVLIISLCHSLNSRK